MQPPQPTHLGLRGFQTDGAVETELLEEELVTGHRLARHDRDISARVGFDDGGAGFGRKVSVEPVLAGAAVEQPVRLEVGHQALG